MNVNQNNQYEQLLDRYQALEDEINGEKKQKEQMIAKDEYRTAFSGFLRGDTVRNALKVGSDGAGGYLLPDEFEKKLVEGLEDMNILRKIGTVITTKYNLKIPGVVGHGVAAWVDECNVIPESDESFNQIVIRAHKIATSIRVSDELLEDAGFDIEKFVEKEFARRIGAEEEAAFLTGDGNGKPLGLLEHAMVGIETETLDIDAVIDLYYSIRTMYRENSVWLMSDDAFRTLYKVKSASGINIWKNNIVEGEPAYLLGKPVMVSNEMPSVGPGATPIVFGDFRYYWIADRGKRSLKKLSEVYATRGQVAFLASQRVDAKLILPEAVKTLKIK